MRVNQDNKANMKNVYLVTNYDMPTLTEAPAKERRAERSRVQSSEGTVGEMDLIENLMERLSKQNYPAPFDFIQAQAKEAFEEAYAPCDCGGCDSCNALVAEALSTKGS